MTPPRFRILGFDLDGTLLDTAGDIAAAVNHALAAEGRVALPVETVATMIGGGVRHMLSRALTATGGHDQATLDRVQARQLAYYADHLAVATQPFAGVRETLDELRRQGVRLAVVTNKVERLSIALLAQVGLLEHFACVIGGDTLPGRGKPAPDPIEAMIARLGGGQAAFVGDSRFDVEAAHAAGIPVIACRFGYRDEPVEAIGADAIIDRFDQLLPTLARL